MAVQTVKIVFKTCEYTGNKLVVGIIPITTEVPSNLYSDVLPCFKDENTNQYYVLNTYIPDALQEISVDDLTELSSTEERNKALALLTDEQIAALGLSR